MIKRFCTLFLFLTLVGISAFARDNDKAAKVKNAVESLTFTIDINSIMGGGETIQDSGTYYLKMVKGHVNSYMPFIGESYGGGTFGNSDLSLSFDEDVKVKRDNSKAKKGEFGLSFKAKAPSGTWDVNIQIWDSGSVSITCLSSNKSNMTYWGELDI